VVKQIDIFAKYPTLKFNAGYLRAEGEALIAFSKNAYLENRGFGYLGVDGHVDPSKPLETYIQCRMIQVFALAHLLGISETQDLVTLGVENLLNRFQDRVHGGFYNAITSDGTPIKGEKLAYDHAFVLLAATAARACGSPRAGELFNLIDTIIDKYFWDNEFDMVRNSWNNDFTILNRYRGINSNMHSLEAFAAAFVVTGDTKFRDRAFQICNRAVNDFAKNNNWMLPEHFDSKWENDREFNFDNPADPFRPYGVTIGHLFEWSRLTLQLIPLMAGTDADLSWIKPAAINLYETAKRIGWSPDGEPGFVYTVDWEAKPIVRSRMFWVSAEAAMAAFALFSFTGNEKYLVDHEAWWSYIDKYVKDKSQGSWFHELDSKQRVNSQTWSGKPDTYHALNASLFPLYEMSSSFIGIALGNGPL
jgi:sulfoquinovose isomerase